MFLTLVLVIHVLVCIALILIILLQSGKGADIGATFGGGSSQTVFGSTGATTFLSKVTISAAVIFMLTSIFLTYFSDRSGSTVERSIMSDQGAPVNPIAPPVGPPALPQGPIAEGGEKTPAEAQSATPADTGQAQPTAPAAAAQPAAPAATPSEPAPSGQ